jgi:hypothetical protein
LIFVRNCFCLFLNRILFLTGLLLRRLSFLSKFHCKKYFIWSLCLLLLFFLWLRALFRNLFLFFFCDWLRVLFQNLFLFLFNNWLGIFFRNLFLLLFYNWLWVLFQDLFLFLFNDWQFFFFYHFSWFGFFLCLYILCN